MDRMLNRRRQSDGPHDADDDAHDGATIIRLNEDLSHPLLIDAGRMPWMPSPQPGVERRLLARSGAEVARAISLVRYAPGSRFPAHRHPGGEEILVLEGVFQDEHGDYPAGTYLRNPSGTTHAPASAEGCVLFVRLWHHRAGDRQHSVIRPGEGRCADPKPGLTHATILFDNMHEQVRLEDWQSGARITHPNARGLELLVVAGSLIIGGETLGPQGWLRWPAGVPLKARPGPEGARLWVRDAPLLHADVAALPTHL
jgi:quercetin dioxygenase-like cupin family protein